MRSIFCLSMVVLFVSCANIPTAEESVGGLFVMPLEVENKSGSNFSFIYTFEIENEQGNLVKNVRIDTNVYKHSFVVGPLPAGQYTVTKIYSRPVGSSNYRYTYKDNAVELGYQFSVLEDSITELESVFSVKRVKKDNGFSTWWNFTNDFSSSENEEEFNEDLAKRVDLSSWQRI